MTVLLFEAVKPGTHRKTIGREGGGMDLFLAKIEDLKRHAELLKRSSTTTTPRQAASKRARRGDVAASSTVDTSNHPYPYEADGVGDWVSHFKEEAGPWTGRPLVVLSLFDGLGGIWQALTILDIPFSGYSSEVEQPAIQVVKKQHPRVKHVGDVTKLKLSDIPEKLDLVIGGFPCQDLSVMGKKEGLHGSRSKLFFQMLRVIRDFQPKWFLVENVASMSWIDREEITRHIGLPPLELDSQELTASKRRRLYWTNIPHPPHLPQLRDHPTAQLQHCLENAIAIEQKCGVILCSNLYKGSNVRLEFVLDSKTMVPRYMRPSEVEVLMGYPPDYTNVVVKKTVDQVPNVRASPKTPKTKTPPSPAPPESMRQLRQNRMSRNFFQPEVWDTKMVKQGTLKDKERWNLLGNTFSVKVIAYLTSPLLQSGIRSRGKPVKIAGSVKEEELSAMEPGDVWALYNEQGKPNWYAVIKSRTGDRFSPTPDHSQKRIAKKTPLKVEMKYLELTDNYLKNEDGWNSHRGSGLFKMRDIVDIQTSWQAFSHRVTSFDSSDDSYFVFPGKDEVWAIWCSDNQSRYFVYVEESTKKAEKLLADKPGEEGFVARCCVLLQTGEHEVFRKTETEVTFTDTEKFEFRAPFHLKHEAGLLKVEVSGLKGRMKSRAASEEELDDEYEILPEEDNEGLTAEELILDDTVLELAELAATPNEASPPLEA